jgi:hypothetical protein
MCEWVSAVERQMFERSNAYSLLPGPVVQNELANNSPRAIRAKCACNFYAGRDARIADLPSHKCQ